jgi:hypothetical protein
MERILFGDNQFFGVNHSSDEKSRAQAIQFKEDATILKTLDYVMDEGVNTFMCTTHDRMASICNTIRLNPIKYHNFKLYPCLPYAHKYANAVTELGLMGTLKQYVPGNFFGSLFRGGVAIVSKDYIAMMKLLVDAEMKIFKGIDTPVIFLQNVITDLLLGLGMKDVIKAFHQYILSEYNAEPGYITMNMPKLLDLLNDAGIRNPIICTSINKDGFRMSGGKELYEKTLRERDVRVIAMQVMSGGASKPKEALSYVCSLPNIQSILFGASSRSNIRETVSIIHELDYSEEEEEAINDDFRHIKIY